MTAAIDRFLRPARIAAVGGAAAAQVVRQCRRMGFAGEVWPVHPHRREVAGLAAYPDLASLPAAPDAAFVGVNRHASVEVVGTLADRGAGGAVGYASGFGEAGAEGGELQEDIRAAAGDMPLLGPNCYGFLNCLDRAALWPDQHGGVARETGVALITQSSNIAINLTMTARGLPVAYVVTLGNQAGLGLADLIPVLAADSRVTAIGLLVEGLGDIAAFADAAGASEKPVVALRAGRSEAGAALAVSHTASLGGAGRLGSARLAAAGIGEASDLESFLETLKLLHCAGPPAGTDLVSLSCSGGEAILMADAGAARDITYPAFPPERQAAIEATVTDLVTVSNPFDYHTFMWGDAAAMTETFSAVMAGGQDMTALVLDLPRSDRCDDTLWRPSIEALAAARARTGGRAAMIATLPESLPEDVAEASVAGGVAPLVGIGAALDAVRIAAGCRPRHSAALVRRSPPGAARTLSEPAAKACLAAAGVPVPAGRVVPAEPGAAQAAARAVGPPVAIKAVATDLAHKTEAGAVALDLSEGAAIAAAAERLAGRAPDILVEPMVADAVAEVLVGYQYDPALGAFLVVASGGTLAELVGDSAVVPLPAERADIAAALDGLRVARLIAGHRAGPAGDRAALIDAVAAVAAFAAANVEPLVELDVNPVMVRPEGRGVVAVDALIREEDGEER